MLNLFWTVDLFDVIVNAQQVSGQRKGGGCMAGVIENKLGR